MLKLKLSKNKRQVYFFYFSRKPYLLYEKNGLESELIRSEVQHTGDVLSQRRNKLFNMKKDNFKTDFCY